MKYLLAFASLLFFITCAGQKPFEGTIVYRLHATDKNDDGQLTILFGKNGVKLKMSDKNGEEKEQLLIRIDSGKLFTLNTEAKTFKTKKLAEKEKVNLDPAGKTIAGFNARAIDMTGSGNPINGLLGNFFHSATAVMYVADSLFYFIPDKYASNTELIFIRNNRIALGLTLKFGAHMSDFSDKPANDMTDDGKTELNAEAISVKWENFNENEFSVPGDFVKYTYDLMTDSTAVADSVIRITTDTTLAPQTKPVKKTPLKTKPPANPKTKPASTKTGAMRKPE